MVQRASRGNCYVDFVCAYINLLGLGVNRVLKTFLEAGCDDLPLSPFIIHIFKAEDGKILSLDVKTRYATDKKACFVLNLLPLSYLIVACFKIVTRLHIYHTIENFKVYEYATCATFPVVI